MGEDFVEDEKHVRLGNCEVVPSIWYTVYFNGRQLRSCNSTADKTAKISS